MTSHQFFLTHFFYKLVMAGDISQEDPNQKQIENFQKVCWIKILEQTDKGQLISEGSFGVFKSPKKWTFYVRISAQPSKMGQV